MKREKVPEDLSSLSSDEEEKRSSVGLSTKGVLRDQVGYEEEREEDEYDDEEEDEEEDEAEEEKEEEEDMKALPPSSKKRKAETHDVVNRGKKKNRKTKKTGGVKDFFIDEASVSDEDDEAELGTEEDETNDLFHEDEAGLMSGDPGLLQRNARRADQKEFMKELLNQNEEEINAYYSELYHRDEEGTDRFGEGDDMVDDLSQQQLFPNVNDPNLWLVRCRIGEEKLTVVNLLKKMITMQYMGTPLQIKSAIAKEGLKGYIYVEAFKQTHVKEAIDGVRALEIGRYKQQMVPVKEMPDVLKVVSFVDRLQPNEWVRVKQGIYRNDLAQVQQVEDAQNLVYLKLIPRIDYTRLRGHLRALNEQQHQQQKEQQQHHQRTPYKRPAQILFDKEKVKKIGGEYYKEEGFYIFEKNRYDEQGYLHKQFQLNRIITEGVQPTLQEAQAFNQKPEDVVASEKLKSTTAASSSVAGEAAMFSAGDMVQVKSGELTNLQGVVLSVEGANVTIKPHHYDLKEPIMFAARDLRKYFNEGDHVKIISGEHEGETGLVVRIEGNEAILMSDLSVSEIKAAPKQLQLCQERATGVDSSGHYIFGDLVMLDVTLAGAIVRLGRDSFEVLTHHGKVEQVKQNAIMRRLNQRNARTLDSNGHQLQPRDVVQVVDGPHSGHQGEIRHIYRQFVFLYSKFYTENGGLFVTRGTHVTLRGTENMNENDRKSTAHPSSLSFQVPQSPRIHQSNGRCNESNEYEAVKDQALFKMPGDRDAHGAGRVSGFYSSGSTPRGGGSSNSQGGAKSREERDLVGKTVRIIRGTMKGKFGVVKNATGTHCSVELHSEYRTELVNRKNVAEVNHLGRIAPDTKTGVVFGSGVAIGGVSGGGMTPGGGRAGIPMGSGGDTLGLFASGGNQTPHGIDTMMSLGGVGGGMTPSRIHAAGAQTPNPMGGGHTPHVGNFDPAIQTPGSVEYVDNVPGGSSMVKSVGGLLHHGKDKNDYTNPFDSSPLTPYPPPLMDNPNVTSDMYQEPDDDWGR